AVAHDVAEGGEVAAANDGGNFFRGSRDLPNRPQGILPVGAVELLRHLVQRGSDDVVMMNMWPDRLGRVEPQMMDEIEIAFRERRRMRAEKIALRAAAAVVHHEPDMERLGLHRALPRLAELTGLLVSRERHGLADV